MSMWRCPHCGTPQAEASRCWVCHRSSTTCSTCRHFRRSIAAQLGYCGLDSRRLPLTGMELRGCWTAEAARPADPVAAASSAGEAASSGNAGRRRDQPTDPAVRLRDFVPVELLRDRRIVVVATPPGQEPSLDRPAALPPAAARPDRAGTGLTLFGEADG